MFAGVKPAASTPAESSSLPPCYCNERNRGRRRKPQIFVKQHIVEFRNWYVTQVLEIEAATVANAEAIKEQMCPLLPEHL